MFYDIAFGDFGDIDFSATQAMIDKVNAAKDAKEAYRPCSIPQAVQDYKNGSMVDGLWNKKLEIDDSVKSYESCGDDKTRILAALVFGTDPDKPLTDDQAISNLSKIADIDAFLKDIRDYKDYLQIKWQQTKGLTTPQFSTEYYKEYFGGSLNYSRAYALASKESENRSKAAQIQSQLLQSNVKFAFGKAYLDFYTNDLQKYAQNFSEEEQTSLRKFFVEETPMMWTPSEFYDVGMILKGRISPQDFTQFGVSVAGAVATSTFEDAGGGMTGYLKRTKDFSDILLQLNGGVAADLSSIQSQGISIPAIALAGAASYLIWKALK